MGDWVLGTGGARRRQTGKAIFAMRVAEVATFDEYWANSRFEFRKPVMDRSYRHAFGDNIYHRDGSGHWLQENSHHSMPDGQPNHANIKTDTRVNRVLIATDFVYWGGAGPMLPSELREGPGAVLAKRAHRCNFSPVVRDAAVAWIMQQPRGLQGEPLEWRYF
ncbi:MAG: hypothetical protein H6675_00625 [Dehalococcoidia bacterium]|nr:hypothetical protein [Dehalococcoidia bacterium]